MNLKKYAPSLRLEELTKASYQRLLNGYGKTRERQTVLDWHRHLRPAILDAVDEKLLEYDVTRRARVPGLKQGDGKAGRETKYLSLKELNLLIAQLQIETPAIRPIGGGSVFVDLMILIAAKTGGRISEVMALTPGDIDFRKNTIRFCKAWNYKANPQHFDEMKNTSSTRTLVVDRELIGLVKDIVKGKPKELPFLFDSSTRIYLDSANRVLKRHCLAAGIPVITFHVLRHTHASVLLYQGISLPVISRRLGHADLSTMQDTYTHIIDEMKARDDKAIVKLLSSLTVSATEEEQS
jgi:integrase